MLNWRIYMRLKSFTLLKLSTACILIYKRQEYTSIPGASGTLGVIFDVFEFLYPFEVLYCLYTRDAGICFHFLHYYPILWSLLSFWSVVPLVHFDSCRDMLWFNTGCILYVFEIFNPFEVLYKYEGCQMCWFWSSLSLYSLLFKIHAIYDGFLTWRVLVMWVNSRYLFCSTVADIVVSVVSL